ncbi:hypothetical protein ACN28C_11340 [Plantactinospora sp. WMMC1484]
MNARDASPPGVAADEPLVELLVAEHGEADDRAAGLPGRPSPLR